MKSDSRTTQAEDEWSEAWERNPRRRICDKTELGWRQVYVGIPGRYLGGQTAYLDLETRKVPAPEGFRMKTGEPLGRRWQAFLAGVAQGEFVVITEQDNDERGFLAGVRESIGPADTVVYQASRRFDEMILKGRFTYARRGPEDVPYFPAMPGAEDLTWDQKSYPERPWRSPDCPSKDVPGLWASGERERVLVHLLRDVVELVLVAGEPDQDCARWCRRVLHDYSFAGGLLER